MILRAPEVAEHRHAPSAANRPRQLARRFLQLPRQHQRQFLASFLRGLLQRRTFQHWDWPIIESGARIRHGNGRILAGRFARFEGGCQIMVHAAAGEPAYLQVGQYSTIGPQTIINSAQRVQIGERCLISWNCDIMDTDFHQIQFAPDDERRPVSAAITIGDDVWIGAHSIILKGVTIGQNSVIGAGSVVTSDVPPNSLAAGNPAKVIRQIVGWSRKA